MRLRFSIRDLLLVTVIAALAIAWWMDHRNMMKQKADAVAKLLVLTRQLRDEVELSKLQDRKHDKQVRELLYQIQILESRARAVDAELARRPPVTEPDARP